MCLIGIILIKLGFLGYSKDEQFEFFFSGSSSIFPNDIRFKSLTILDRDNAKWPKNFAEKNLLKWFVKYLCDIIKTSSLRIMFYNQINKCHVIG